MRTADIRALLVEQYAKNPFTSLVEIKGASFLADAPSILRPPNPGYIERELTWYGTESLNINDFPGEPPAIWRRTANEKGEVNSNYGWVVWSSENGNQFDAVVQELQRDWASRRAVAIYTRPSMHVDQKLGGGGQDFMCTNAVHYSIDPVNKQLNAVVQMRSNDVVFGYNNDYAWQQYVLKQLVDDLRSHWPMLHVGDIIWQAASLHVYPRHFHLLREAASDPELRSAGGLVRP